MSLKLEPSTLKPYFGHWKDDGLVLNFNEYFISMLAEAGEKHLKRKFVITRMQNLVKHTGTVQSGHENEMESSLFIVTHWQT